MSSDSCRPSKYPEHSTARRRRVAVRDDWLAGEVALGRGAPLGQPVPGRDEHHELVAAERDELQIRLLRIERQHAKIEAAVDERGRDLPRGHALHVHEHPRVVVVQPADDRHEHVHAGFVRPDAHAPALQVPQVANGAHGLVDEREHLPGVLREDDPGFGELPVLDGAVEQPLAQVLLEPPDGLAHGRLRAIRDGGGFREAPAVGDREKHLQLVQFHRLTLR